MSDGGLWSGELAVSMLTLDKELKEIADFLRDEDYGSSIYVSQENPKVVAACETLKGSSQKLLANVKLDALSPRPNRMAENQKNLSYPGVFLTSCATCHTRMDVGPFIPFEDQARFNSWLRSPKNREMILYRLNTSDHFERMPLNRNLSRDELAGLNAYIQKTGTPD